MRVLAESFPTAAEPDAAEARAAANRSANLAALSETQPWRTDGAGSPPDDVTWVFARDGSLSGMLAGERWWAGCSLPTRAAQFMLRTLDIGGTVACFLSPLHAAQLRVALDLLEPRQAIVAIVPDERTLAVLLHCDDFSREIVAHRLWFVAGDSWAEQLRQVFKEAPGLPTPAQFIRPILADSEPADRLIAPAQKVFADEASRRSERIDSLARLRTPSSGVRRLCLIAPTGFRLWESAAPELLADLLYNPSTLLGAGPSTSLGAGPSAPAAPTCVRLDTDDPASASPLALAAAVAESDAVIASNTFRADAPGVVPSEIPWITWITSSRIPSFDPTARRDVLILADRSWRSDAAQAGWPAQRLHVAGWPDSQSRSGDSNASATLTLLADTQPIEPPEQVTDYSSQLLLWEMIQAELTNDPFLVGDNAHAYLADRIAKRQIAEQGFDRSLFVQRLIVPAYQQGLARVLIASGLPVQIFGKGWDRIDEFAVHSGGPVTSRQQLREIVEQSAGLVHAWPSGHAHPIDAAGRPVLRAAGRRRDHFLRDARTMLNGAAVKSTRSASPLSARMLRQILQAV